MSRTKTGKQESAGSTLTDAKRSPADTSAVNPFHRNRVYFHLDCLDESETIKSVKIELQTIDETKTLTIPVTVLEKRDTTLHKLAARAMLDDLERCRSNIRLGPNKPYPGTWEEKNKVRKEAEEIACKWSLVSKWTSFFLAEEPYKPTGEDAFMDAAVDVNAVPGENLLEPRGKVQHVATVEPAMGVADTSLHVRDRGPRPAPYMVIPPPPPPMTQIRIAEARCREAGAPYGSAAFHELQTTLNLPPPPPPPATIPRPSAAIPPPPLNGRQDAIVWSAKSSDASMHATYIPACHTYAEGIGMVGLSSPSEAYHAGRSTVKQRVVKTTDGLRTDDSNIRTVERQRARAETRRSTDRDSPFNHLSSEEVAPLFIAAAAGISTHNAAPATKNSLRSSEYDNLSEISEPPEEDSRGLYFSCSLRSQIPPPSSSSDHEAYNSGKTLPDRDFVKTLLNFQRHDGAIDFGDWPTAEYILGSHMSVILRALQGYHSGFTDLVLWTAAVNTLLQQRFRLLQPLWMLMASKMGDYLQVLERTAPPPCRSLRLIMYQTVKLAIDHKSKEYGMDGFSNFAALHQETVKLAKYITRGKLRRESQPKSGLDDECPKVSPRVLGSLIAETPSDNSGLRCEEEDWDSSDEIGASWEEPGVKTAESAC
ncbi:hypothetical protein VTI28DRAFT_9224 [Corynascus sepedonium]